MQIHIPQECGPVGDLGGVGRLEEGYAHAARGGGETFCDTLGCQDRGLRVES